MTEEIQKKRDELMEKLLDSELRIAKNLKKDDAEFVKNVAKLRSIDAIVQPMVNEDHRNSEKLKELSLNHDIKTKEISFNAKELAEKVDSDSKIRKINSSISIATLAATILSSVGTIVLGAKRLSVQTDMVNKSLKLEHEDALITPQIMKDFNKGLMK